MNKKGVTIIELLISISIITVVVLLLIRVMFSLNKVNNDDTYASNDEIARTEIIKEIESDFLELSLNGININNNIITFYYEEESINLTIESDKLTYKNTVYSLNSDNATYSNCISYSYLELDNDYYYIKVIIPVLIDNEDTTINDNIILSYLGLKNENSNYLDNYTCNN